MLKPIFAAKINPLHLLLVNVLAIFLTWFIIRDIAPFVLWGIVGDGPSPPHSWDIWLNAGC